MPGCLSRSLEQNQKNIGLLTFSIILSFVFVYLVTILDSIQKFNGIFGVL